MLHTRRVKSPHYPLKKHLRNLLMMLIGSLIVVAGFTIFITPNDLLSGGVWGVAAILSHYLPQLPIAVFLVILNIPLLIWGWSQLSRRFALYTVYVILLQSALLLIAPDILPEYTKDPLLSCLFGGLLVGVGGGLIVKYHGSGGGSDIIGIILKGKYDISVGTVSLCFNAVIVLAAGVVFGFELAMYTMVELFVASNVFTQMLEGLNRRRNMMIVTTKGAQIAARMLRELGRGVTMMQGEGGYTHNRKDVLFCVLSRFELSAAKEIIHEVDENAFVCINQTYEVMGRFPRKAMVEAVLAKEAQAEKENAGA